MKPQLKTSILLGAFCIGFGLLFTSCEKDIPPVVKDAIDTLSVADSIKKLLALDMVAYYPFNGNATDETGHGHNGTVNGATLVEDRLTGLNKAYSFDGNSYITLPVDSFKNTDYTYTAWIKLNEYPLANDFASIISIGGLGEDQAIGIANNYQTAGHNGILGISYFDYDVTPFTPCNNTSTALNKWMHIALTRDNQFCKLYVNGKLASSIASNNLDAAYNSTQNYAKIGARYNETQNFNGIIDNIRIYKRALEPGLIAEIVKLND